MGGTTTTSTTESTSDKVNSAIGDLAGGLSDAYASGYTPYPDSTYAGVGGGTSGFDAAWYIAQDPNMEGWTEQQALEHYLNYGQYQGRDPGPTNEGVTTDAWDTLLAAASNPSYTDAVASGMGYNSGLIDSGGMTDGLTSAYNTTTDATSGYSGLADSGGLTSDMSSNISAVNDLTSAYADLYGYLDQEAPGYQTVRNTAMEDAITAAMGGFLTSGMFGSQSYIDQATTAATDAIASLDYENYLNSLANKYQSLDSQLNSNSTAFGMSQQGVDNTMAALAGQLSGAGQEASISQQGVNNTLAANDQLGTLYDYSLKPGETMLDVGTQQDADRQAQLDALYGLYNSYENADTDLLATLSSILNGTASASGTETTSTSTSDPWATLLSALIGGAALAL